MDAGCALGFLVEAFRNRGVEAFGVDISKFAIENVHADIKPYCWAGSVSDPFPQKYDLITCIEVLEHMRQKEAEKAIENLCAHANEIVFSSTPFDYKESTHFNVQPDQVRMLRQQIEEKEQTVQTLTAQLTEILISKARKLILLRRQIRVKLLPPRY